MADLNDLGMELELLKREGRFHPLTVWDSPSAPWMMYRGRQVLQLSSNNYLGLTNHPEIKKAAIEAIDRYGVGSGSVRTITGTFNIHDQLEQELAQFKGTEACLTFQSGFTANQGILTSIVGDQDLVISDELNHASIIDGIRLSKTHKKIFAHKDTDQLEKILAEGGSYRRRVIVTDGVFSMDGDIAPLPQIVQLAEQYDALVYVDDAHGSGVLGQHGKGTVDHFNLQDRVDIQVGTLSKAVGVLGGYMAGPQVLKDYLIHQARPFLFSTSHPPSVAAACLAAIRILSQDNELQERLWGNTTYFRKALHKLKFDTGGSETPIIPIIIGEAAKTHQFSEQLLELDIFAQGIVYPTVDRQKGRVRIIITAAHSKADLDFALERLEQVGKEFGII